MGRRFWGYSYRGWQPTFWQYVLPWFGGGDEYGRKVVVIPVHPFGFLCFAYWTCRCPDCNWTRVWTGLHDLPQKTPKHERLKKIAIKAVDDWKCL